MCVCTCVCVCVCVCVLPFSMWLGFLWLGPEGNTWKWRRICESPKGNWCACVCVCVCVYIHTYILMYSAVLNVRTYICQCACVCSVYVHVYMCTCARGKCLCNVQMYCLCGVVCHWTLACTQHMPHLRMCVRTYVSTYVYSRRTSCLCGPYRSFYFEGLVHT